MQVPLPLLSRWHARFCHVTSSAPTRANRTEEDSTESFRHFVFHAPEELYARTNIIVPSCVREEDHSEPPSQVKYLILPSGKNCCNNLSIQVLIFTISINEDLDNPISFTFSIISMGSSSPYHCRSSLFLFFARNDTFIEPNNR